MVSTLLRASWTSRRLTFPSQRAFTRSKVRFSSSLSVVTPSNSCWYTFISDGNSSPFLSSPTLNSETDRKGSRFPWLPLLRELVFNILGLVLGVGETPGAPLGRGSTMGGFPGSELALITSESFFSLLRVAISCFKWEISSCAIRSDSALLSCMHLY